MKITSIETTPNPNSMKLNLSEVVGEARTYTSVERNGCPPVAEQLLDIAGVKSIFVCKDFITVNREPMSDWQPILDTASRLLGGDSKSSAKKAQEVSQKRDGEVSVLVQTFRGIPIQVKAVGAQTEKRLSLGESFNRAAMLIQDKLGADFLKERYWADWGVRYGTCDEIAAEVTEEITATTDEKALAKLVSEALGNSEPPKAELRSVSDLEEALKAEDWHVRLSAVQDAGTDDAAVPLLSVALRDAHPQVRRLAAAALGATGNPEAVGPLCQALLEDQSVGVRRTAGDALSDLGDAAAQASVCQALKDPNKLVRWRAARFLSEVGTTEALSDLRGAVDDSQFEVQLEVEAAIERIEGGLDGSMPAWKRIVENK